jgi:3'(2'), 5'-bisphosphate nucleotidase
VTRNSDIAGQAGGLLDELTLIISRAAAEIMRVRASALSTRLKPDQSPVTTADEASETVITEGLSRLLPGTAIVSEETGMTGAKEIGTRFVLVDPLDGTRELLAGRDEFTVNIAILDNGAPTIGLVAAPVPGLIWRGIAGRGAERMRLEPGAAASAARERIAIHTRPWQEKAPVAAVSRSHLDPATTAFLARWPHAQRIAAGSAIKFCRLAEGEADVYPRLSPTYEWDVAAGHAVLAAAGGIVLAPGNGPIVYGRTPGKFLVPGFIAWGDPAAAVATDR